MAARIYYSAFSATEVSAATTTWVDGGSLTFTPTASKDYIVLWSCQSQNASTTLDALVRLFETSSRVAQNWEAQEAATPIDYKSMGGMYKFTAGGSPSAMTFKIQISAETTNSTKGRNFSIIALELGASDVYAESLTRSTEAAGTPTTKLTLNITPATLGDYLLIFTANVDSTAVFMDCSARVDTTLIFTADFPGVKDTANVLPWCRVYKKASWSAAAHTADIRFDGGGVGTAGIAEARIVALRLSAFDGAYYAEQLTDNAGTQATYQDVCTLTQTTLAADHLLAIGARGDSDSSTVSGYMQGTEDAASIGEMNWEDHDPGDSYYYFDFQLRTLTAASHTWKIQRKAETAGTTIGVNGAIAALQVGAVVASDTLFAQSVM